MILCTKRLTPLPLTFLTSSNWNGFRKFLTFSNHTNPQTWQRDVSQFSQHSRSKRARWVCQYGPGSSGRKVLDDVDGEHRLHVVFVHPQIHWNTGNIGRTCLGLGATLHLIGPLGFSLDEKQVRRAGLDYWEHVNVNVYENWDEFANGKLEQLQGTRYFFTKFGQVCATDIQWPQQGKIVLVFGSEVNGFDGIREWLDQHENNDPNVTVAFPMVDQRFRSFNLSTTASMVSLPGH